MYASAAMIEINCLKREITELNKRSAKERKFLRTMTTDDVFKMCCDYLTFKKASSGIFFGKRNELLWKLTYERKEAQIESIEKWLDIASKIGKEYDFEEIVERSDLVKKDKGEAESSAITIAEIGVMNADVEREFSRDFDEGDVINRLEKQGVGNKDRASHKLDTTQIPVNSIPMSVPISAPEVLPVPANVPVNPKIDGKIEVIIASGGKGKDDRQKSNEVVKERSRDKSENLKIDNEDNMIIANNGKRKDEKRKNSKLGSNEFVGVCSKDSKSNAIAERLKRKSNDVDESKNQIKRLNVSSNKVAGRKPFKEIVQVKNSLEKVRFNAYDGKNVNRLPFRNVNDFSRNRNHDNGYNHGENCSYDGGNSYGYDGGYDECRSSTDYDGRGGAWSYDRNRSDFSHNRNDY